MFYTLLHYTMFIRHTCLIYLKGSHHIVNYMRNNVIRYEFDKRCSVLIAYPYYKTMLMYNSVTDVITYKHFDSIQLLKKQTFSILVHNPYILH